jgi:transmembrane sensor
LGVKALSLCPYVSTMQKDRLWYLVSKKLAQEATAQELAELEELLRQHPEMHYAIQHIQDLWKLAPQEAPEAGEAFRKHRERMQNKGISLSPQTAAVPEQPRQSKYRLIKRYALAGLAIAATVTAAIIFIDLTPAETKQPQQSQNFNEISTRNGSRTRISLPDGSTVWLNAGSKLVYDKNFDSKLREVSLTGEGYFDVVKNPDKPFIIHAGKVDIKVLGTVFNVKSYPGERSTEASLIHGSIEVVIKDRPQEKIILKPNEKIIVSNQPVQETTGTLRPAAVNEPIVAISHLSYEPNDSTIIETSWVENRLIFQNEPFRDLAVKMERWFGVTIQFENEEVQQLRFRGSFTHETIHQALAALKITGGFNYKIDDNKVIVY